MYNYTALYLRLKKLSDTTRHIDVSLTFLHFCTSLVTVKLLMLMGNCICIIIIFVFRRVYNTKMNNLKMNKLVDNYVIIIMYRLFYIFLKNLHSYL